MPKTQILSISIILENCYEHHIHQKIYNLLNLSKEEKEKESIKRKKRGSIVKLKIKKKLLKKSQITASIIIGLLLLFSIAFISYLKQIDVPSIEKEKVYEISTSVEPVRSYVENCLKEIGKKAIKEVALHGGKINLQDNLNNQKNPNEVQYLNNTKINYLCLYEQGNGCINQILFREDLENEISYEIENKLKECVDLDIFRNQGFSVKEGEKEEINSETKISDNEVSLTLKYPLKLSKENLLLEINTYGTKINVPFGLLFKTSINILNSELQELNFDSVGFMKEHGNILVEKFKPYPDIIYRLTVKDSLSVTDSLTAKDSTALNNDLISQNNDLVFQFAIQGKDTVSEVGYDVYGVNENNENGCCYNSADNSCYKNSAKKECEEKSGVGIKGIYKETCNCEQMEIKPKIGLNPIQICKNTYGRAENNFKGMDRINSESWCSSESGFKLDDSKEAVGSRQYVHYCIEGKEYVEPCRDYREELCVEKYEKDLLGNKYSKATCRPNRWQDCIECETQECCEDSEVRDCAWQDELSTSKKCVPAVAPGFKFWEFSAITSCTRANQKKECSGISCSQEWVDDTAKLCYMQGDCGNYRNTKNVLTGYGFLNTDLKYKPQKKIYDINSKEINSETAPNNGNNMLNKKNKNEVSNSLSYDATERAALTTYGIGEAIDANAELLSAGLNYINEITTISFSDFINPFKGKPIIHVLDISLCGIWQAPRLNQDCSYCTKNPFTPCTEYLCKSLGQQCIFDYNLGNPLCKQEKADDKTAPKISIDKEAISYGYKASEASITSGNMKLHGYKITPELLPHTPFTIGIKADEKVTCKLALMPFKKFNELKGIYFGQQTFSDRQNITLRVPSNIAIPQNMMDILNYSHYEQVSEFLEEPEDVVNNYQEKYKTPITLYNTFSGEDIVKKMSPVTEMIKKFIEKYKEELPTVKALINLSLSKFENNTYMLFVQCMDEAGNENTEPMFIEFSIKNESIDDIKAPVIIGTVPENSLVMKEPNVGNEADGQKISVYLDEPSECRYDYDNKGFEEMKYSFECSSSEYKLSPAFGGTYECSSTLSTLNEETQIYIKCKDNPFSVKEYYFYVETNKDGTEKGKESKIYSELEVNNEKADKNKDNNEINKNEDNELASNNFFNFTEPNKIYSSLSMFESKHLLYAVNNSDIEMHLFKDRSDKCMYTFDGKHDELDFCMRTDNIALGTYECIENINLNSTSAEKVETIKNTETLKNKNDNIKNNDNAAEKKIYNISFKCPTTQIAKQNINEESYVYVLKKSPELKITETLPKGEVKMTAKTAGTTNIKLTVKTTPSKDVRCRYKKEFALSYMDMIKKYDITKKDDMTKNDSNVFTINVDNLQENTNTFVVKCTDYYGNSDEEKVEFYVVK